MSNDCISCLRPLETNDDGLCEQCAEWDKSLDGSLLALLTQYDSKDD